MKNAPEWSRRSFLGTAGGAALAAAVGLRRVTFASASSELDTLDAVGQAELVRTRQASPLELLDACVARLERVNPQINAVVSEFLDRARKTDKGSLPKSPLSGVPYLIKDLVGVKAEKMTAGSRLLSEYKSPDTSPAAAAAMRAGLVIFGKTNTCEFGLLPSTESVLLGPARNPWNLDYSTGGSSGGAAAAVAAGVLPVAHATDAGGSIRVPASCCGLFGLKTSRFRVPNPDPMDGAPDVEFCVSRTVRDSAMMLSLSEDRTRHASLKPVGYVSGAAPQRLKIAFCTQNIFGAQPDSEVRAMLADAARLCESLGHRVVEVNNPVDGEKFLEAFGVLWGLAPRWGVDQAKKQHLNPADVLEPWTLGLAQQVEGKSAADIAQAVAYCKSLEKQIDEFMAPYDVWLTPVTFSPSPRIGELAPTVEFTKLKQRVMQYLSYTPVQNATGAPAMSVPLHWTKGGLPFGSHFSAKLGE